MLPLVLAVVALALGTGASSCDGSRGNGDGEQALPGLSVVTVNIANATNVGGFDWKQRIDKLAGAIVNAQLVPDIISMTESSGLWHCSFGPNAGDYDLADRLISDLHQHLDARYRIAYMVGTGGNVKNFAGTPVCWFYSGDTLLYNPDRLANLTPADVAGRAQVSHDNLLLGFQVRHSLPICARGETLEPLETLIDGPPQTDPRCPSPTPSGPAWAEVVKEPDGSYGLVASLARFSLSAAPGSSFDVVTTHPTAGQEDDQASAINNFIAALAGPAYRTGSPYYPVVVLGDFNKFASEDFGWPANVRHVFNPTDVMVVALGDGVGLAPQHQLNVSFSSLLPSTEPCSLPMGSTNGAFSDHCGLVVRFTGS
jgi:hypothetical protein